MIWTWGSAFLARSQEADAVGQGPYSENHCSKQSPQGREAGLSLRCSRLVTCPLLQSPLHPTPVSLEARARPLKPTAGHFLRPHPVLPCTPVPASPHVPNLDMISQFPFTLRSLPPLPFGKGNSLCCSFKKDFSLSQFFLIPV